MQSWLHTVYSWLQNWLRRETTQLAEQLAAQSSDRSPPRAFLRNEDLHAGVLALHAKFQIEI